MQIRFQSAVMLMAKELALSQASFSIHEITNRLRDKVNNGEIAFTDRTQEVVNGNTTFKVEHPEVKEIFGEVYRLRLTPFQRQNDDHRGFMLFSMYGNSSANTQSVAQSAPIPANTQVTCAGQMVTNVPLPDFSNKLTSYLQGRGAGSEVTMKQIQSRFDTLNGVTCADYGAALESLGYRVSKPSDKSPSNWYIVVQ